MHVEMQRGYQEIQIQLLTTQKKIYNGENNNDSEKASTRIWKRSDVTAQGKAQKWKEVKEYLLNQC